MSNKILNKIAFCAVSLFILSVASAASTTPLAHLARKFQVADNTNSQQCGDGGIEEWQPQFRPNVGYVGCGNAALAGAWGLITRPNSTVEVAVFCDGREVVPDPVFLNATINPPTSTQTWWTRYRPDAPIGTSPLRSIGVDICDDSISFENSPTSGNKGSPWPRCKIFGGGSIANGQVTSTNSCPWWNKWGLDGGAPELINCAMHKSTFRRLENFVGADPFNVHGTGGPITFNATTPEAETLALRDAWVTAFDSVVNPDINSGDSNGFGNAVRNFRESDGVIYREDTWSRLKGDLLSSNRFKIQGGVQVFQLIWDNQNPYLAKGFYFFSPADKKVYKKCFKDEVVVAGGVINTNQFLLINGIGPAADLASVGVPVKIDNAEVGKGLGNQYQAGMAGFYLTTSPSPRHEGTAIMGLVRTPIAVNSTMTNGMVAIVPSRFFPGIGLSYAIISQLNRNAVKGQMKLLSKQHDVKPQVSFNFFVGAEGVQDLDQIRYILKKNRDAMALLGMVETAPGYTRVPLGATDAQWNSWILEFYLGNWHLWGGACAGKVVDGHLRVYNASNLRVGDSSAHCEDHDAHASASTALGTGILLSEIMHLDHPEWTN